VAEYFTSYTQKYLLRLLKQRGADSTNHINQKSEGF